MRSNCRQAKAPRDCTGVPEFSIEDCSLRSIKPKKVSWHTLLIVLTLGFTPAKACETWIVVERDSMETLVDMRSVVRSNEYVYANVWFGFPFKGPANPGAKGAVVGAQVNCKDKTRMIDEGHWVSWDVEMLPNYKKIGPLLCR